MKVKVRVKTFTFRKERVETHLSLHQKGSESKSRNLKLKVKVSVKAFTSIASEFFNASESRERSSCQTFQKQQFSVESEFEMSVSEI